MMVPVSDEVMAFLDKQGYEPVSMEITEATDSALFGCQPNLQVATNYTGYPRLIIRKKFTPPDWLQPGWLWTNDGKVWLWSADEPECKWDRYTSIGTMINTPAVRWTPPTVTGPTKYEIK